MNDGDDNEFPIVSLGQIGKASVQTVDARKLHAFMEVGKDFSSWLKDRISQYDFTENVDFVVLPEIGENPKGGRPAKEYAISIDMAKELAMVERNEKGKQVRRYFIECERKAKQAPAIDVRNLPQLQDIALQLIEVNREQSEQIAKLEHQVEEAAPKTEFYDKFASADGLYGLQNAARILDQPPNKFSRKLKDEGYIFYQGGALVPYRKWREKGIFEVKATIIDEKPRYRTWVTPKGIEYFAQHLTSH